MAQTLRELIKETTRQHLKEGGLLYGQAVSAVGWINGTVPELTEAEGIVELPNADVAGPAFAVGGALMGKKPILVVRFAPFMWYNAVTLVNYAAKSKEIWGVPCSLLIRNLSIEGEGIGPTHTGVVTDMFLRSPGFKVFAPMTPGEWTQAWTYFKTHDDVVYVSEQRAAFGLDQEMENQLQTGSRITLIGVALGRLRLLTVAEELAKQGIKADLFHLHQLKPLTLPEGLLESLKKTGRALVVDSGYEMCGTAPWLAYELMKQTGFTTRIEALGLVDKSTGCIADKAYGTPEVGTILKRIQEILN